MSKKITLSGGVGDEIKADALKAELPLDGSPVEITLSSIGGYISDGFMLHNLISQYPGEVTLILSGFVASIAAYVTTAVPRDKVSVFDDTVFMIHNAMGVAVGDHKAMVEEAEILKRLDGLISGGYAKQTGKTQDEIIQLMGVGSDNKGSWFFGQEIIDAGFAGQLIASGKELNKGGSVAAAFNSYRDIEINPKRRALDMKAVAKMIEVTNQAPEPDTVPQKEEPMTKEELIAEAKKLGVTSEEFANAVGSKVYEELAAVKQVAGDDPVNTFKDLKKRERDIILSENFGPELDADGKVNELRDYANRALTNLSKESIEEFKKSPAAVRLAGERADEASETNSLGKKETKTDTVEGGLAVSPY